jgi:abequosyltransferase
MNGPRAVVATPPVLSICVPTYNFGAFIGHALESMLSQLRPGVEIVVLDSGSTDETREVVMRFQSQSDCLRYERAQAPCGIDRDMARVVELARGDYCWLFSADDVMVAGAIGIVLEAIEEGRDLLLCLHSNDSLTMEPIQERHPVLAISQDATFELADDQQLKTYFALALTTEAFFSFMGGLIVRRATWNRVDLNEQFVGSCWAHVARLFELIPGGLSVHALDRVLLRRRGGNDSFGGQGVVRRYALAIDGYLALAAHFWGNHSEQAFHVRRVLRREFGLPMLLAAKMACAAKPAREDRRTLDRLVSEIYCDRSMACRATRFAFWAFPTAMIPFGFKARRWLRKAGL